MTFKTILRFLAPGAVLGSLSLLAMTSLVQSMLAQTTLAQSSLAQSTPAQSTGDVENSDNQPPTLPLGTVTLLGPAACLPGAPKTAACTSVNVSCPRIADLTATLATTLPTGTPKGTIILLSGHNGTTFLNSGFPSPYLAAGFRVVQLAWASEWEDTNGLGLRAAACRGASVFKYVFDNVHLDDRTAGFCAQGTSGGGAAIAYALAQYGLANYFDYVVIAAGPGVARLDYGCDKALYTGGPLNLCSQLTNAPYAFTSGGKVNAWENTTTCATKSPLQSDIKKWVADSIITSTGTYSYPKTAMSWFMCVTPPVNNSTGEGKFLIDKVAPKTTPDVNCYSGVCTGEAVWQDPGAFAATESEMVTQCVGNHSN